MEADSEEDEEEKAPTSLQKEDSSPAKEAVEKTPAEIAFEVLNEIVDIVLESGDVNTDQNQIVTN